jgi:hypothetical protein
MHAVLFVRAPQLLDYGATLCKRLEYFAVHGEKHPGRQPLDPLVHQGKSKSWPVANDTFKSGGRDKSLHPWAQGDGGIWQPQ